MDNTQKPQTYKIVPDNTQLILLAISTDTLIYMKSRTEARKTLISGDDKKAYLIEGSIAPMMKIIDRCFQAREENLPVKFNIDGVDIIFK